MTKAAIVKKEEQALVIPKEYESLGQEDVEDDKIVLGYLKCIQKGSPEVDNEVAKTGDFYDTGDEQNLGLTTDIIIVKKVDDWAKFPGDDDPDETPILWSEDGSHWQNGDELTEEQQWKCKRYRYYVILAENTNPIPLILILKSTSKKAGSYIASMIKRNQKLTKEPLFARSYKLTNNRQTKDKYSFQVIKATLNSGFVDETLMKTAFTARQIADAHAQSYDVTRETPEEEKVVETKAAEVPEEDLGLETETK